MDSPAIVQICGQLSSTSELGRSASVVLEGEQPVHLPSHPPLAPAKDPVGGPHLGNQDVTPARSTVLHDVEDVQQGSDIQDIQDKFPYRLGRHQAVGSWRCPRSSL
jgi:hypothetical protein